MPTDVLSASLYTLPVASKNTLRSLVGHASGIQGISGAPLVAREGTLSDRWLLRHAGGGLLPAPGPCVLVIFGASGDLTRRLLVPHSYNLHDELLTNTVVGVAGMNQLTRNFGRRCAGHPESNRVGHVDPAIWDSLEQRVLCNGRSGSVGYTRVAEVLKQCDRGWGTKNYLFYLRHHRRSLARSCNWVRLTWPRNKKKKRRGWRASSLKAVWGI